MKKLLLITLIVVPAFDVMGPPLPPVPGQGGQPIALEVQLNDATKAELQKKGKSESDFKNAFTNDKAKRAWNISGDENKAKLLQLYLKDKFDQFVSAAGADKGVINVATWIEKNEALFKEKPEEPQEPQGPDICINPQQPGPGVNIDPLDFPRCLIPQVADEFKQQVVDKIPNVWKRQIPDDKEYFVAAFVQDKNNFLALVDAAHKESDVKKAAALLINFVKNNRTALGKKVEELKKGVRGTTAPTGPEILDEDALKKELAAKEFKDFYAILVEGAPEPTDMMKQIAARGAKKRYTELKEKYKDVADANKVDQIFTALKNAGWKLGAPVQGGQQGSDKDLTRFAQALKSIAS